MLMNELYSFLESISSKSDFDAELSRKGGYITFSNSGRRGGAKFFQIGIENIIQTLQDILNHLDVFQDIAEYEEKAWRDNGAEYFTDPVANANSTVQTKPLFSTLSKIIIWANQPVWDKVNPDKLMALDRISLQTAINKLQMVSESFTPVSTLRMTTTNNFLQQIYYGAPGTGKSHKIKSEVDEKNKICYRTTFHPDSDYSTFVGAYKPSMEKAEEHLYNKEELISKLTELKEQGVTYSPQKFGAKYWYSLKGLSLQEKKDILTACYMSDNYTVEFDKGIAVGEELLKKAKESRIIYGFIPQAFAKAYVHAWNTKDEVYLVIEEINRGHCAQIFGDLFQLLDRKDGFSEYPIDADDDLESHIKEKLEKSTRDDIPELVKAGKKLMLPSNLYIWATMNTSDQSLFPIDSAFKRRWDWVYTPIKQHDEEYKIVLGEDAEYDWWGFLEKINQVIDDATSSEDKKLGYFFVKAQDKKVSAEKFVGKVLFYLWNDVFKNYGFDSPIFSKGGNKKFAFSDFFTKSGEPEPEMVKAFLDRLDETIDKENSFKIKNKSTGNSAETAE